MIVLAFVNVPERECDQRQAEYAQNKRERVQASSHQAIAKLRKAVGCFKRLTHSKN